MQKKSKKTKKNNIFKRDFKKETSNSDINKTVYSP